MVNGIVWKSSVQNFIVGWESTVSIKTRYGLDGPCIKSHWGKVFSGLWTILKVLWSPQPNSKNSRKKNFQLYFKNLHLDVTKNQS